MPFWCNVSARTIPFQKAGWGISIVSGTVGAVLSSDAQNAATKQNAANVAATNAANLQMFNLAHGSAGNELLPQYFGGTEKALGQNAQDTSAAIQGAQGSTNQQLANTNAAIGASAPGQALATKFGNSIFDNTLTNQELGYAQPVQAANTALARTQGSGILEGLNQTLNSLQAQNQAQGFTGGSSFENSRLLGATIGARQQAAGTLANAGLQNAQMSQGIQESGIQRELANMNTPSQLLAQNLAISQLPGNVLAQNQQTALAPYSFFKVNPTAPFQYQNLPMVQPNSVGAAIAGGIGSANNALGSYFTNQALTNQLKTAQMGGNPYYGAATPFGTSATGEPLAQTSASLAGQGVGQLSSEAAGGYAADQAATDAAAMGGL